MVIMLCCVNGLCTTISGCRAQGGRNYWPCSLETSVVLAVLGLIGGLVPLEAEMSLAQDEGRPLQPGILVGGHCNGNVRSQCVETVTGFLESWTFHESEGGANQSYIWDEVNNG